MSKRDISLALGAVLCIYHIKYALFIALQVLVLLASIPEQGGAEEVLASNKSDPYRYHFALLHNYFLGQHNVDHFVVYVSHGELRAHFRPAIGAYLDFVKALEITAFGGNLINGKACKLDILGG